MLQHFDLIVVGGGHAGLEAAWSAAQFESLSVALLSLPEVALGNMPCNPSIGGVGKGQVVRELDALGGLMGQLADRSAIQCRILNESKGYAVQSTRFQVDKFLYSELAEKFIEDHPRISLLRERLEAISHRDELYTLSTSAGTYTSSSLILTTGTFLNGLLHCGEESVAGGIIDCAPSHGLGQLFADVPLRTLRFKTGTPPRLKLSTIDLTKLEAQPSDPRAQSFHWENSLNERHQEQICCYMAHTNPLTMEIIRSNRARSPLFNGQISGVGPRYCPSIEDKAFRYPDRNTHHVFVEPEGLTTESTYVNGLSTSLPKDVQEGYIHSIIGLENSEFLRYGYAVEYDVIDTTQLSRTLECQSVPGLFFAGQVNGTSGYEEAAAQGLIAGFNAALRLLGKNPLILDRHESYIGVLIEDLVSNTRDEPYRLFTARSENRLYLREDNTLFRMMPYRQQLGIISPLDNYYRQFVFSYYLLDSLCDQTIYRQNGVTESHFSAMNYGPIGANISLTELMKRSQLDPVTVLKQELAYFQAKFDERVIYAVAISKKYDGYIKRADAETERFRKMERRAIRWEELYNSSNISYECRQRIKAIRPETFGQLMRMEGIRPATLAYVAGNIVR